MTPSRDPLYLLTCALLACLLSAPAAEAKPNIVLILADDMGHGHVGCLNPKSKIRTPHIDRLAKEGITFTDAHSGSSVCSPTRYGLLTGRYAWRTKLVRGVLGPYDPPLIEKDRLTLPALLRKQGYHTACVGKWHLGWDWPREGKDEPDFTKPIAGGPTTRGFDFYFGTDVPNYPPYAFIENDRVMGKLTARKETRNLDGRPGPMLPGWKFDAILPELTKRATSYIEDRAKTKKPFFLFFSLTSPHEPIAPSAAFRGKSELNPLADFLMETDATVGAVLDALKRAGVADNTLVIFTADNGSSLYAGGAELRKKGHEPSAGFRGVKASIYEGGHRVPFFARWPGKIKAGSRCAEPICLTDCMATLAAVTGSKLPDDAAEDSFDLLPLLTGKPKAGRGAAVIHQSAQGRLAIREGSWKLILPGILVPANRKKPDGGKAGAGEPTERELYHIPDDPGEKKNVLAAHKDVEKRLAELAVKMRRDGRSRPSRVDK